jgi:hypothetical protein
MRFKKQTLFPLVILLSMQGTSVESKQLYRWTDDQGTVHYSDVIPPKESKYGRSRLSEKGITLEEISAAKTKQQLNQEKRLAMLRAEKQKIIAEQLANDRVLLRTFRNTDEIQMTLEGKEQTLNLLSQLTQDNIKRLKEQLSQQQKRAASLEKNGLNVPQNLLTEINATRRQIKENENKISAHEREKERLRNKFEKDKVRFIALKNQFKTPSKTTSSVDPQEIVSIVECKSSLACKKAWLWAKRYINQHATTPLQIETDTILMTQTPVADQDLSLTITLITGHKEQPSQLFLDTECKPSRIGQELCESPKVKKILAGFSAFIDSKK